MLIELPTEPASITIDKPLGKGLEVSVNHFFAVGQGKIPCIYYEAGGGVTTSEGERL
jgi:hypothetical protein